MADFLGDGWPAATVWALVGLALGPVLASLTVRVPTGRATVTLDTIVGGGASHSRIVGVAVATAVVLASVGWTGSLVRTALPVVAAAGVALVVIDVEHHRLPDLLVLSALVLFVAVNATTSPDTSLRMLATGAAMFGVFLVLALVSPSGIGFGDVKLAALVGVVLGRLDPALVLLWLLATSLASLVWVGWLLLRRRATLRSAVPFGPPMLAGLYAVVLAVALT